MRKPDRSVESTRKEKLNTAMKATIRHKTVRKGLKRISTQMMVVVKIFWYIRCFLSLSVTRLESYARFCVLMDVLLELPAQTQNYSAVFHDMACIYIRIRFQRESVPCNMPAYPCFPLDTVFLHPILCGRPYRERKTIPVYFERQSTFTACNMAPLLMDRDQSVLQIIAAFTRTSRGETVCSVPFYQCL